MMKQNCIICGRPSTKRVGMLGYGPAKPVCDSDRCAKVARQKLKAGGMSEVGRACQDAYNETFVKEKKGDRREK